MPWSVKKMDDKFCVVKEGETAPIKGGCHVVKSEAAAHVRALYASEAEHAVSEIYLAEEVEEPEELSGDSYVFADNMKEYAWEGPIVFENVATGDNRIFKSDSIVWQEETLPWAFRWQKASGQGHAGSVPVGRVDRIERREDGSIYGFGVVIPELSEEAGEYLRMLQSGVGGGVSVDGDSAQFEIQEKEGSQPRVEFSSMRLRALSAVDIPAFNGARIKLVESPSGNPPVEMSDEEVVEELAEKPFPFMDEEDKEDKDEKAEDEETEESEEESEDEEDKEEDKDELCLMREELAKKKRKKKAMSYGWSIDEALTAAGIPVLPSTDAFVDPQFDGPTALTVTPDGRVFGHLALFNTCHIGFPGTCVKPPKGSKYQYFHTGEIETAEGDLVQVGKLTFKTGHAEMAATPRVASEHYDNTGAVAADVRAGEDQFGIWVVGALRPTLSDMDIREFRAAPLSGDWRRIAGKLELVGALSVNVPGFPVPRVRALVASGETETLFTFLQEDDEEFDYEIDSRIDRKLDLAARVSEFLHDEPSMTPPDGKIQEDVPDAPSKKDVEARVENYTKNQLFADLKAVRELLDDRDEKMSARVRKGLEELYDMVIKVDTEGKRTTYNGLDLDIIDASGLEIEEWESQLELSGLNVEEFYNQCHDADGRFCEGQDGPGRVRDKVQGRHQVGPGEKHNYHDIPAGTKHGPTHTGTGSKPSGAPSSSPPSSPPGGGGGGVDTRTYENFRVTRKRATGWAAAATIALAALKSPAAGILQGIAQAGGVAILGSPAVLTLIFATGVSYAAKNALAARRHKTEFNRQIDRKISRDRLNARQQRERDRLSVSS